MMNRACVTGLAVAFLALSACASSGASKTVGTTSPTSSPPGAASFCAAARGTSPTSASSKAANPLTDESGLRQELARVRHAAAVAPTAIRGDLNTLSDYYARYIQAVQRAHGNPRAFATSLRGFESDRAVVAEAAHRVSDYILRNCSASVGSG
jgi:hypothetical protein